MGNVKSPLAIVKDDDFYPDEEMGTLEGDE